MEIKYTPEQDRVVHSRGKNLLVSASAGSGKTTIMIKRIVDLMKVDKVPLEKFLIVTFTKASAEDMKRKLIEELRDTEPSDFLLEQMMSVPTADISNLHSFCSRLIAKYFYKVGLDPIFNVIEENEQLLLMERAATALFEEKERSFDESYFKLFEIFQKKRSVDGLKDAIFKINGFANSILGGIDTIRESITASHEPDIFKSPCTRLINIYVCSQIEDDVELCEDFANRALSFGCEKYYEHFIQIIEALRSVKISNSYIANAKNLMEMKIPTTPSNIAEEHKFLSKEASAVKESVKKDLENYKKNFISSDIDTLKKGIEFSKAQLLELLKLTESFEERYKRLKREVNVLDFNDLEKYALEILSDPALLEDVKQKYSYIFVDEYQDINEVQEKFISLLAGENNLFMVGDIKQSIYRFRYCDPDIFLNKSKLYESGGKNSELIRLNCNFRSDKNILAFVDSVFSDVMTEKFGGVDYASKSCFEAGENNADDPSSVDLCFIELEDEKPKTQLAEGVYSVKEHEQELLKEDEVKVAEANFVAHKISQLISGEQGIKFSYSDIVILTPSRTFTNGVFVDTLKSHGIPISSDDEVDLMGLPHIEEVVNFLRLSVNRLDDMAMFKALKSSLFNFSDDELIKIRLIDSHARFFECVEKYQSLNDKDLKAKVESFLQTLSKYEFLAKTLTAKDFVCELVEQFEIEQTLLCSEGGEKKVHELNKFIGSFKDESVLEFITNSRHFALGAKNESSLDAVRIMSIHGSKGMEFKAVFLVGSERGVNIESTTGDFLISKQFGAGMAMFDFERRSKIRSVVQNAISMQEKRILVEEYQRLLYVALTRAKYRLFVVCSGKIDEIKDGFAKRVNCFFDWFKRIVFRCLNGTYKNNIVFEHFVVDDFLFNSSDQRPQLILNEPDTVQAAEEFVYQHGESVRVPLKNSVSKLLNDSEDDFDDEYEQFESAQNEEFLKSSAKRGTAYHRVFQNIDFYNIKNLQTQVDETIDRSLSEGEKKLVDKNVVINVLNLPIFRQIGEGDKVLKEREFFAKIPVKTKNNCAKNFDCFTLQGVIDLLIIKGDEVWLIDYKTGKINSEKLSRYAMQLELYSDVAARALEKKVTKKALVMIDEQKIIEI